jgi:predicted ATPase/class 3 adenylate cyclase
MTEPELPTPPLALRLFGPFEARLHGAPLPHLRTRKGSWLLALLALRHGAPVERAWLAGLLWPDSSEGDALASLRKSLTDLRRALGSEAHRLRSPSLRTLALDLAGAEADVVAFDAALARADRTSLENAVSLYRGPLLEGCAEEWVFEERKVREQGYLEALERLATWAREAGDTAAAERSLRQAVAVDPTQETAQRGLMALLAGSGNYAGAVQLYRELRGHLHRELNAEPDAETRALFEQIRAEARRRAQAPPSVSTVAATRPPATPQPRAVMGEGTLTFLFTDIEGSTRLWETQREGMRTALARHDALLRAVIAASDGDVFKTVGDQFCAAFANAPAAIAAAFAAQRALLQEPWSEVGPLRVRMALYTGLAEERDGDYFGPPLNRVARLLEAGHGGQVLLSLATAELVRDDLPEGASLRDLGERRLKDLVRAERIFQFLHPALPGDFPPLRTLEARPHNLPAQLTPLVGREAEVAAACALLRREEVRLVTCTGPGGIGKTRLALQVAAELLDEFEHGVWFVDLAPLRDPDLLASTVAQVLGVREEAGRPVLESLKEHLREKQTLLVLDNFEQIVEAGPRVTELLAGAPGLKVLVTSRELLNVRGEHDVAVPPLGLPEPQEPPSVAACRRSTAIELFCQRAAAVKADLTLTDENAAAVTEICRRLDGLPLAIELAAARVRVFPPQSLLSRLEHRLKLLVGGARDLPSRQQTLRDTIAWSYDLLEPEEQTLFRRLSVFVGGCTLEAAETVGNAEAELGIDVWNGVASLVEKHLLRQDELEAEPRFGVLETIREYGIERLVESGEAEAVQRRHAAFFLAMAEESETALKGKEQAEWVLRLVHDHDNLRAAFDWALERGEVKMALRFGGGLRRFWADRGYRQEGWKRLEAALALPGAAALTAARAKALNAGAGLRGPLHGPAAARPLREESLAIYRALGDKLGIAANLNDLGVGAKNEGRYAEARALLEESLALARELGGAYGVATVLYNLACTAADQGDHEAARPLFEESLTFSRALGNPESIAFALWGLGDNACARGDYPAAAPFLEECLTIARSVGNPPTIARALEGLARLAYRQGEYAKARALYAECLTILPEVSGPHSIARIVKEWAMIDVADGRYRQAGRLLAASEALRDSVCLPLADTERAEYDAAVAAVRAALGEEELTAVWCVGRAMSSDQAISAALHDTASDPPVS